MLLCLYYIKMGMERWSNKVAIVTGASSGIGAAVASDLIAAGVKVVALARRQVRLQQNQNALPPRLQSNYYPITCDVTSESEVKSAFQWVERNLGGVDILVNNAGVNISHMQLTTPGNTDVIRKTIDTNLLGTVFCVREAFSSMQERKVAGHVVIVNSIGGHKVPMMYNSTCNVYFPTKYALTAMTEIYRQEFDNAGTKIKITSVSPGLVDTAMVGEKTRLPLLDPGDVSDAILYTLGTAPHVQIHEMIIKPLGEKF